MKTTLRSALLASLLIGSPLFAQTTVVPQGISYQATITDQNGAVIAPLPGAAINYEITLKVFPTAAGGVAISTEVFSNVPVSNGRFSVILGQGATTDDLPKPPLVDIFNNESRFVEITVKPSEGVGNSKTFAPRQQLLTSPTSIRSMVAEVAQVAQTVVDDAVGTDQLTQKSITTLKLADVSVTDAKLADASVTTLKLADISVTTSKLADASVTTSKLADISVTNAKLGDNAVNSDKIQDLSIQKIDLEPGLGVPLTMVARRVQTNSRVDLRKVYDVFPAPSPIERWSMSVDATQYELPSEGVNGLYLRVHMSKKTVGDNYVLFLPDGTKGADGKFDIPLTAAGIGDSEGTSLPWNFATVGTFPNGFDSFFWNESIFCPVRKSGNSYVFDYSVVSATSWAEVTFDISFQIIGYY